MLLLDLLTVGPSSQNPFVSLPRKLSASLLGTKPYSEGVAVLCPKVSISD